MNSRKIRIKKLNVKQPLSILKEDEIDATEYESLTQELQVATGVEAGEENEYHLQVLLKTAGQKVDNEIPVPPPQESSTSYEELYSRPYSEPASYVRFSQTVEECIGCNYDMTEEDDAFLKEYNAKRPAAQRLSEDDFEKVMEAFEENASHHTPFAAVDKTILDYEAMAPDLNVLLPAKVMTHSKAVYEHWKSRKEAMGNGSLQPSLKFETHQESDDLDPYICFRRREVRQTRKTRARDVQSADKLKRLRKELEEGRQLILLSREREIMKGELLRADRMIFEKRAQVKEMKVRLGIKGDDEDLINQKAPPKKKHSETPAAQRAAGAGAIRLQQPRPLGPVEVELPLLESKLARQNEELRSDIMTKIQNHQNWNRNHVDLTKSPLPPVENRQPSFRAAQAQYLLTPPASSASGESGEPTPMDLDDGIPSAVFQFKGAPVDENNPPQMMAYRRRFGRLNRMWIDRRPQKSVQSPQASPDTDRWKYDQDESDDDQSVYEVDPYDTTCIRFRATIPLSFQDPRRHQRQLEAAAQAQAAAMQAASNGQQHQQGAQAVPKPLPVAQKQDS
ncbi:Enhancer of polycomb-like protein 1 [Diaporthe eres]|uniref:Enhancer of polycomb-like protein n=1 Tax=Diaporthe eres TaxID=83184 RepID=A0ABR1NML6_DIAER